ncbi:hypothetical protein CROQUDRAFT_653430 [Cronartium quercuum f. sp. fusiforme G11]|uniref:Bacterial surface antigen (D15) domain-containing protein n=1 Tax=Cronartium quercuum f. sp. fusiforme G11 TaxID=708437 RepID=A0A9P6NQ42_9BASI|nr:hypothetical protein CROQUDRAFT_653430 [Cronartium quercuum f. sp. fusiforme G11]
MAHLPSSVEEYPQVVFDESDVDRQLAWHESRLATRLESQQQRSAGQLRRLLANDDTVYKLSKIRLSGAVLTRPDFLRSIFAPVLSKSEPQKLTEILTSADQLHSRLAALDLFSSIKLDLHPVPDGALNEVELRLSVSERGRFFLKTSTDVGSGEGALTGLARGRNLFGGGELLEGSVGLGSRTRASYQLRAEAPVLGAKAKVELSGFGAERDLSAFASCHESLRGVVAKLKTVSRFGQHELWYELVGRRIGSLAPTASISIREAAGESLNLKSAVAHSWAFDSRDHIAFPTRGCSFRLFQEYAGLGGEANYLKSSIESSISRTLFSSQTVLSLGFQSGLIHSLAGRPVPFSDRFRLGGPTSVRMFHLNSLGPKDGNDYLGGQIFWAGGLSLWAPLPGKPNWPLRVHGFLNAGRLTNTWSNVGASSIAVGLGLAGQLQGVRIEANIGVPISVHEGDGSRRGLQVGLGIGFLS